MTRGSIPRFDLYEELEISRLASVEVVEAAYRALVKRHHPDVSRPDDAERIKRLNVAREWLTSPSRRARYDAATAVPGESTPPASRVRDPEPTGAARRGPEEPPRPARASSPASFGVHSRYVRQFLAHLRELDGPMARELLDARAAIDANAYAAARGAALAASRHGRNDEWTFAREAASVIARGKLHDQALVAGVVAIVADVAGAIVVRDLLPPADFDLLLAPWRGREAPVVERPAAPARSTDPASVARPFLAPVSAWLASVPVTAVVAAIRERRPLAAGISGLMLVTVIGLAVLGSGPSKEESAVAALTAGPPAGAASGAPGDVAAGSGSPSGSGIVVPPSGAAATPSIDPLSSAPPASPTPGQGSFIPVATPRVTATPRPPTAPPPTSVPTSAPTVAPTPPPTPTPSPEASCTVVSLIGVNTSNAQLTWTTAGFTGTVVFGTPIPPQYKIGWQSLNPGDSVPCTSDVTVQLAAP